jgi:Flp pilus assembly protein TadD
MGKQRRVGSEQRRQSPKERAAAAAPAVGRIANPSDNKWKLLLPILLLAAGLLAYHSSFAGAFLFDDDPAIVHSPEIRQVWPFHGATAVPPRALVTLSLAINYALGGLELWGYHAVNVAIHLLAALVLYGILCRTLQFESFVGGCRTDWQSVLRGDSASGLAVAIAILWAVHPLQTESVTYLVQRAQSLQGLLYLLTLYCVLRGAQAGAGPRWWYAAAIFACALGMASKEDMCTAPLLVLVYDRIFLARSWADVFRRRWALYLGLAATWLILTPSLNLALGIGKVTSDEGRVTSDQSPLVTRHSSLVTSSSPVSAGFAMEGITPLEYARSQPGVILHYLRLSLWPDALCLDYGWPVARSASAVVWPGLLVGGLILLTICGLWRCPPLGFAGAWFFLILAPTSSIMPIADLAVERRMYLPLAAVITLVVLGGYIGLHYVGRRLVLSGRATFWLQGSVLVTLTLLLSWRTIERNDQYRDPVAIWSSVLALRPDNPRAYKNLAVAHTTRGIQLTLDGKVAEAEREFRTALDLKPSLSEAHINLGALLASQSRVAEAEKHFQAALDSNSRDPEAHYNLGLCLARQEKVEEGMRHFSIVVELKPDHAKAHYHLGASYAKRGDVPAALGHLHTAIQLNPDNAAAHYCLGVCLASEGKKSEAMDEFRTAAHLNPQFRIPDLSLAP